VTGIANVSIPADAAVILVQCPALSPLSVIGSKLLSGGIVIDYWNGALDSDNDGLPNWWESRYYGNPTNALPQAEAVNGYSNLQSYFLGLDPTNPLSTFRAEVKIQAGTGYPQITWSSIGGKRYAVEYANSLSTSGIAFAQAVSITETNVAAGVASTETFLDDYSLTGGPSPTKSRFYRVRLVGP